MSPPLCFQCSQLIDSKVPAEANSKAPLWFESSCLRLRWSKKASQGSQKPCGFLLQIRIGGPAGVSLQA